MTWEPLAKRIGTLPLVLAGPLLRRVTPTSVSVWLALKEPQSVQLVVKRLVGSVVYDLFHSEYVQPVTVGSGLHIVCVTATAPSRLEAAHVRPDGSVEELVYGYDLNFSNGQSLEEMSQRSITYGEMRFPSFVLPATTRERLMFCHGSCRKPHGPFRDALPLLDKLLRESIEGVPAPTPGHVIKRPRPQFLVLTGDQIYADDVADALLFMIRDASRTLLDAWDEEIPGLGAVSAFEPGRRAAVVQSVGFTSGVGAGEEVRKSHLMALGEYLMMYLFAWSDVLWGSELPGPDVVYGTSAVTPTWDDESKLLALFRQDLPSVRRALANIPSYMAMDDHEVTDDWNVDAQWCLETQAKAGPGRHIIANGLTAFALCQAWGNTPEAFAGYGYGSGTNSLASAGDRLFSTIDSRKYRSNHQLLEKQLLPSAGSIFAADGTMNQPEDPIAWNFALRFDAFDLIALDTRTSRQFATSEGPYPLVIGERALRAQLDPPPTNELVLLVLAAPLCGVPHLEIVQRLETTREGRLAKDCEAPGLQPFFAERLLARLALGARQRNVVMLCGDVHYGFAVRVRFNARRLFREGPLAEPVDLVVSQFTSSALRNCPDDFPHNLLLHKSGDVDEFLQLIPPRTFAGFVEFGNVMQQVNNAFAPNDLAIKPAPDSTGVLRVAAEIANDFPWRPLGWTSGGAIVETTILRNPGPVHALADWSYRISFLRDDHAESFAVWDRLLVGRNNLGLIWVFSDHLESEYWSYKDGDVLPDSIGTSVSSSSVAEPF